MIVSTVVLLLVSGGFVTYELVTFRHTMINDLSALAEIVGDRSTAALLFDNKEDAEQTLHALKAKKHITAAALYDVNGNLFATYASTKDPGNLFPRQPAANDSATFVGNRLVIFSRARSSYSGAACLRWPSPP